MFKNKAVVWIGCMAIVLAAVNAQHASPTASAKPDHQGSSAAAQLAEFGASKTPVIPADTAPGPRRIIVIGDSLAEGTAQFMPTATPGFSWQTDAKVGRPMLNVGPLVAHYEPQADAFVIALGTNDCVGSVTDKELERRIFTILGKVLGAPTAFVTVGENGPIAACAVRLNKLLKQIAGVVPKAYVLDWQAQAANHPEWYGAKGDGIHLTPAGYKARAIWMTESFNQLK